MKYAIFCLFFISSLYTYGQNDTLRLAEMRSEAGPHLYFSVGMSYQKQWVGEVGLMYGSLQRSMCNPSGMMGVKLATEFNFDRENRFIAPKLSVEADILLVGLRLNIIDYTNFNYHDVKLTPEFGLTINGYVNLFYGRNYALNKAHLDYIPKHRISLTFNLDKFLILNQ
jgi:hypothetical protein